MPESVTILDVRVDAVDKAQLLEEIAKRVDAGGREYLANVNINAINIAQQDDELQEDLEQLSGRVL